MYAIGDEKRLVQTLLNVFGNAVKFSKEGGISITAFVAKPESFRDTRFPDFLPVPSDSHFYLRVQVCFFKLDQYSCVLGIVSSVSMVEYNFFSTL